MIIDQYYPPHSIRTYTGKVFCVDNLQPEMICIEDIAHALANTARWGGHTKIMLSVAQHSINVASTVPKDQRLAGLLHDASEAYIGDMPSPIKSLLPDFKKLEDEIMKVISKKFGFQYPFHPSIKDADRFELDLEWNNLKVGANHEYGPVLSPLEAEREFLKMYRSL